MIANPFDDLAAEYDNNGAHAARAAELIKLAADALADRPPAVIFDVATGTGAAAFAALAAFPEARVTAIDLSAAMINRARERADQHAVADRIEWRCGSAVPFPAATGSADLVLCTSSLHFLGVAAFADWQRVLRPDGLAAYTLPLRSTFAPGPAFAELLPAPADRAPLPESEQDAWRLAGEVTGFVPVSIAARDGAVGFVLRRSSDCG